MILIRSRKYYDEQCEPMPAFIRDANEFCIKTIYTNEG